LRGRLGGTYRGEVRAWWAVGIGEKFVVRNIISVCRKTLDSLEGTQTLFTHLAPVPAAFYHGSASSLETVLNSGYTESI
jgi:hypothetical protein